MTSRATEDLLGLLLERSSVGVGILDAAGRYVYVNQRLAEINGLPVADHIGNTLDEVIPHISSMVADLHEQVLATGQPILDVQIEGSTPGAPDRIWQVSYMPLEVGGERAVGAVLLDVTERERAVAGARRRASQHATVADLGQRALGGVAVADLMDAATESVTQQLGADFSGVLSLTAAGEELVMCAGYGWPDGAIGAITARTGRASQAGYTLLEQAPVLSQDLHTESRFEVSAAIRAQHAGSSITIPIPGVEGPFGVLGVFARSPGHLDLDDVSFVRGLANVLGSAVIRDEHTRALEELSGQRGRLVAQALDSGEREQRQVADVLHDDVLQHLLFARQELGEASVDRDALARAGESVERAAALLRRVVAGLHPITLAHAGLAAALENMATDHAARAGLRTSVHVDAAAEGRHDRLMVSLVRELLTNVAKHAGATHAVVRVCAREEQLELTVADDGRGMPADAFAAALGGGSVGLATVRERVEALGGSAQVAVGLGGSGATVQVLLPL